MRARVGPNLVMLDCGWTRPRLRQAARRRASEHSLKWLEECLPPTTLGYAELRSSRAGGIVTTGEHERPAGLRSARRARRHPATRRVGRRHDEMSESRHGRRERAWSYRTALGLQIPLVVTRTTAVPEFLMMAPPPTSGADVHTLMLESGAFAAGEGCALDAHDSGVRLNPIASGIVRISMTPCHDAAATPPFVRRPARQVALVTERARYRDAWRGRSLLGSGGAALPLEA